MVGGGRQAHPGEISLAHCGVLFLDELPEFAKRVLEVLREPLEAGVMELSRAEYKVRLPASFQLVAAMNPCPCDFLADGTERCACTPTQIARYRGRISGPLLDRIDLHIEVPNQSLAILRRASPGESSAVVRERVLTARELQLKRQGCANSRLQTAALEQACVLTDADAEILDAASACMALSMRACHRLLRVARTIADLAGAANIQRNHLLEALGYRLVDRPT